MRERDIALLIVIDASIITASYFFSMGEILTYWWTGLFSENFVLGNIASIVAIVSLGLTPIIYFTRRYLEEKNERSRASRNLYGELHDALDGLDEKKYQSDFKQMNVTDKNTVYYMNRFLNHDIYDSLVNSGKINFLTYEFQQKTQDIFNRIKMHNYYLKLASEMLDAQTTITDPIYNYFDWIGNNEKWLLKEIPIMMQKLEKEFDFPPINN